MEKQELTPAIGIVQAWLDGVIGKFHNKDAFVYHRGHLAFDREQMVMGEDGPKMVVCVEVDEVAKLTWAAHERGEVVLSQKRIGVRDWLYLAQRSRKWRRKE